MKAATKINETVFRNVVAGVEANGPLASMGAMIAAVTTAYNNLDDLPANISPSLAKKWIEKLKIETKTQPAKRKSSGGGMTEFPVDKSKFLAAIAAAESEGGLENLSTLYEVVASRYNNGWPEAFHLTPAIVAARIKAWGLPVQTVGKKGRAKGSKVERNTVEVTAEELAVAMTELAAKRVRFTVKPVEGGYHIIYPLGVELSLTIEGDETTDTEETTERLAA